jgi:hypothetical protein
MTSLNVRMRAPAITQVCPQCQGRMTLTQITPISLTNGLESTDGLESAAYMCGQCRSELEQTYCAPRFEPVENPLHPGQSVWRRGGFERVR